MKNLMEIATLVPAMIEKYSIEERFSIIGVMVDSVAADMNKPIEEVYELLLSIGKTVRDECGEMEPSNSFPV